MEDYMVREVRKDIAKQWCEYRHYAKRVPSVTFAYGLELNGSIVGICTFGKPPMSLQRKGVCGEEYSDIVWELNRLVTEDNLGKNVLSFFVSQCLKLMPKPSIIISYADKDFGHQGYIYQATNFYFVGETQKHKRDITIEGSEHLHQSSITDKFRGVENRMEAIKKYYGDKLKYVRRSQKNRYVYFCGNKKQKKELKNELKYKIKQYPKGENSPYELGEIPQNKETQCELF